MRFSNCVCNSLFLFQEKLVWFDLTYVECLCYVYFIKFTFSQYMYWLFILLPSPHISFNFDYLVWNYFNWCIIILHKPITFLRIIFINQSLHPFHLYIRCHGNCMVLIGVFFSNPWLPTDNIQHETISLETASGGVVNHPRLTITLANGASLTNGRIGQGVSLEGYGQYLDLGNNGDKCMGNLDKCRNGLTISLWIKARKLEDGTYFLSSPSNTLSYEYGQLVSRFFMNGKMWEVSSPNVQADQWHQVVMSWSPNGGAELYLDGKKQGATTTWSSFQGDDPTVGKTFVGRSKDNSRKTVNALVDEIQYIYAQRDQAIASGQLQGLLTSITSPSP